MWKKLRMRRILHPFRAHDGCEPRNKPATYDGPFADLLAQLDQIPYRHLRKPIRSH